MFWKFSPRLSLCLLPVSTCVFMLFFDVSVRGQLSNNVWQVNGVHVVSELLPLGLLPLGFLPLGLLLLGLSWTLASWILASWISAS